MQQYIKLIRPKDWAKNLFLFIPAFFAGNFFNFLHIRTLLAGFIAFCCYASSIYIINDYMDIENDRNHPIKKNRPLASGKVSKRTAILLSIALMITGTFLAYIDDRSFKFLFILSIYFSLNLAYCFGLKNIGILDILVVAIGFVLRIKAGAALTNIDTSQWLVIMTFLLALLLAVAKRRDDMMIKLSTGSDMRKSIKDYNLVFLNTMLGLFSAIIIVSYIMYTIDGSTQQRLGSRRLYYTGLFVVAGIMRYLQITFVEGKSGSPTTILFKDRFIQITLILWMASFYVILYLKGITFFSK